MLLIAGTIPVADFPLSFGDVAFQRGTLHLNGRELPCLQGTGAMLSASSLALNCLNLDSPRALIVGDVGDGKGSKLLYEHLIERLPDLSPAILALHYWLPSVVLMKKLNDTVTRLSPKPILIADAGSMYAAKAAGVARSFDLFTPDPTEMSFLADPDAFHPAYIRKHLFEAGSSRVPQLVAQAYKIGGAARVLLVKGAVDYVVQGGNILEVISQPNIPAMEAIGGTGDTITGLASALIQAEVELHKAAAIAAKVNRLAGQFAQATPATRVSEIVTHFPVVFDKHLSAWMRSNSKSR